MVIFPHDGSTDQDQDLLKSISIVHIIFAYEIWIGTYFPFHDEIELPTAPWYWYTLFYNILGNPLKVHI
jgi:hypothetical protein